MRKMIVAGNWKMHTTPTTARDLAGAVVEAVPSGITNNTTVLVCPPFTSLHAVAPIVADTCVALGAQNCSQMTQGAFTGEVSPESLAEIGCGFVIVGHSERRQYAADSDAVIGLRARCAIQHGITPIVCIGEQLHERESGATNVILESQLLGIVETLGAEMLQTCIIAYEPVWAIGTGIAASPEQAQDTHRAIRTLMTRVGAQTTPILYGGSVTDSNAENLFACPDIDGALCGGSSLKADQFSAIIAAAMEVGR